jgi:hypothetical protein
MATPFRRHRGLEEGLVGLFFGQGEAKPTEREQNDFVFAGRAAAASPLQRSEVSIKAATLVASFLNG